MDGGNRSACKLPHHEFGRIVALEESLSYTCISCVHDPDVGPRNRFAIDLVFNRNVGKHKFFVGNEQDNLIGGYDRRDFFCARHDVLVLLSRARSEETQSQKHQRHRRRKVTTDAWERGNAEWN